MMGTTTGIQASPQRESPLLGTGRTQCRKRGTKSPVGFRPGTVGPPREATPPPDDQANDDGGGSQPLRSPWTLQIHVGDRVVPDTFSGQPGHERIFHSTLHPNRSYMGQGMGIIQ